MTHPVEILQFIIRKIDLFQNTSMQFISKSNNCNHFSVHRIGRTGRSGKQGIATTFINKSNDESVLLDLKHLLMEAKQKVPTFLAELGSENEKYLNLGGNFSLFFTLRVQDFARISFNILTIFWTQFYFYNVFSRFR